MILKLNEHLSQPGLEEVNAFIAGLVAYAAADTGKLFDPEQFRRAYPEDEAWLLNHPNFIRAMDAIYRLSTSRRKSGFDAVSHDRGFHTATLRGEAFQFKFPQLSSGIQEAVGELYKFFYSQFRLGIKLSVVGRDLGKESYRIDYWDKNPVVRNTCPVCLNRGKADPEHEVEHYFPKGSACFVMLILHPYNLYMTCSQCNSKYKGQTIPLKNIQDDLRTTFLPFHGAALDEVTLRFDKKEHRDCVEMVPSDLSAPYTQERIRNLDRMFHLEERWTEDLEGYLTAMTSGYAEDFNDNEMARFEAEFSKVVRRWEKSVCSNPASTIQSAYYRWILDVKKEAVFASIVKKPR